MKLPKLNTGLIKPCQELLPSASAISRGIKASTVKLACFIGTYTGCRFIDGHPAAVCSLYAWQKCRTI